MRSRCISSPPRALPPSAVRFPPFFHFSSALTGAIQIYVLFEGTRPWGRSVSGVALRGAGKSIVRTSIGVLRPVRPWPWAVCFRTKGHLPRSATITTVRHPAGIRSFAKSWPVGRGDCLPCIGSRGSAPGWRGVACVTGGILAVRQRKALIWQTKTFPKRHVCQTRPSTQRGIEGDQS